MAKIAHIAMWVKDLEASKDFYLKYFNCKSNDKYTNSKTGFESYFLTFEDNCRLEIMHKNGFEYANLDNIYGLAHIAISVGSKENVDTLTNLLRKDGFTIASEPRTTGDGYYESVVLDNENNRLEITV